MRILAYEGISPISRAIRWQTRSPYSHVAILTSAGNVIEAVPWHGVVCSGDPWQYHRPNTRIDVFDFTYPLTDYEERVGLQWLLAQVGKPYDYRGVIRFVTRVPHTVNGAWFCSELIAEVCNVMNRPITRLPAHNAAPRDVVASPKLIRTERLSGAIL